MSDWVILRTSGRHTLPLAESLTKGGFETWTPMFHVRKRRPRTNARIEQPAPLLPTYVFARATGLQDLIELADAPSKPHPDFSIFHYLDRIPLIADMELQSLRYSERRRQPKPKAQEYHPGDPVQAVDGAWAGMSGVVERRKGKFAMVLFPMSRMSVKIATFLLLPSERKAA